MIQTLKATASKDLTLRINENLQLAACVRACSYRAISEMLILLLSILIASPYRGLRLAYQGGKPCLDIALDKLRAVETARRKGSLDRADGSLHQWKRWSLFPAASLNLRHSDWRHSVVRIQLGLSCTSIAVKIATRKQAECIRKLVRVAERHSRSEL